MALGILAGLSARARAAYPIIRGAVNRGLSSSEITKVLQDQGIGIRRQTLLDIIRDERGAVTAGARLRNLGSRRMPNPERLPKALTRLRRAYSFVVEVRGINSETGETMTRPVTVSTSRLMSRADIEAQAMEYVVTDSERYGMDALTAVLTEGRRAGDLGTL